MTSQVYSLILLTSVLKWCRCSCEECPAPMSLLQIRKAQPVKCNQETLHDTSRSPFQVLQYDGGSQTFKNLCSAQPANGRFTAEKVRILGTATSNSSAVLLSGEAHVTLSDVLEAITALEEIGHQSELQDLSTTDATNAEMVRASLFAELAKAEKESTSTYLAQKSKMEAVLTDLMPRKQLLEERASLNMSRHVHWVNAAESQDCQAACQQQNLHCDASGMYLPGEEQARSAFSAAGKNCTDIFEAQIWGEKWDGPWSNGGRCAYVPHEYWMADCHVGCNYARLCPCSATSGFDSIALPASEPTHKLGAFADVATTLSLGDELMAKGTGAGGEERATVGHSSLQCLSRACLVYSFGAGYETKYEKHMASLGCRVHVFDCTMTSQPSRLLAYLEELKDFDNIVFHSWCVGDPPAGEFQTAYGQALHEFYTLEQVMGKLNHTTVDIVKFDIEGFEWGVIDSMLKGSMLPAQMAFELHTSGAYASAVQPELVRYKGQYEVDALFLRLFSLGYRIANKELNAADASCAEFVVVRVCGGAHRPLEACD